MSKLWQAKRRVTIFDTLGNFVAYDLFGLVEGTKLATAVQFFVMDVTKILVLVTWVNWSC